MSLKVELKPGERLIVGECLLTNADQRARLLIDGDAPILREKDIMTVEEADSPAKRIYLSIQLMYTARDPRLQHSTYFALVSDLLKAAPSMRPSVEIINTLILSGKMYQALKQAKNLIAYEGALIQNARGTPDLHQGRKAHRKRA
ncbi:MAG TPA: flagellar biosynthesis repressor FlbT [Pseudolabrys sp.]|nr:flagellar biosynthesis repressor FlbT [Pseudolabrys sp.]